MDASARRLHSVVAYGEAVGTGHKVPNRVVVAGTEWHLGVARASRVEDRSLTRTGDSVSEAAGTRSLNDVRNPCDLSAYDSILLYSEVVVRYLLLVVKRDRDA